MTDDLTGDALGFDLLGAIEGTTFPEAEVDFWFDAAAANLVNSLNKRLTLLGTLGRVEEYEALEPVFNDALANLADSKYTVTVRGVPREVKKAWVAKAEAKHADKKPDKNGFVEPNLKALQYIQLLQWQSQIVKIENPEGKVNTGPFDEAIIDNLLNKAPEASLSAVAAAIEELDTGAKAGYEVAVRNLDFSQEPSAEEPPEDSPAPSE